MSDQRRAKPATREDKLASIYARSRWAGFVSGSPAPPCPVCGCVIWRAAGVDGSFVSRARRASSPSHFSRGSFFCYECLYTNGRLVMASATLIAGIEDALIIQVIDHSI